MFIKFWKAQTPLPKPTLQSNNAISTTLNFDEQSALWYVGGYIIRSLRKKINKSCHQDKSTLLYWLEQLIEVPSHSSVYVGHEDDDIDDNEDHDYTLNWINAINHGHLVQCINDFHTFLYTVELHVKTHCSFGMKSTEAHLEEVMGNKELLMIWKQICAEDHQAKKSVNDDVLLHKILSLYITIRGFRYTAKFMENFKKSKQKNLQKEKSLRTKLQYK
jgi:hypothetical protein